MSRGYKFQHIEFLSQVVKPQVWITAYNTSFIKGEFKSVSRNDRFQHSNLSLASQLFSHIDSAFHHIHMWTNQCQWCVCAYMHDRNVCIYMQWFMQLSVLGANSMLIVNDVHILVPQYLSWGEGCPIVPTPLIYICYVCVHGKNHKLQSHLFRINKSCFTGQLNILHGWGPSNLHKKNLHKFVEHWSNLIIERNDITICGMIGWCQI